MAAFATYSDLAARWRTLTAEEQARATILLGDASEEIRAEYPTIDALVLAGLPTAETMKIIVCRMVKRAMITPDAGEGVESQGQTAGPFGATLKFSNPMGNLYLTKQDRRMMGFGSQRAFTIDTAPADSGVNVVESFYPWDLTP